MSDQHIANKLREMASGPKKTDTARLRDIFDDIEFALARKTQSDVLSILHEEGFKFTAAGFRYSLAKIRSERGTGRLVKNQVSNKKDPPPKAPPPPPETTKSSENIGNKNELIHMSSLPGFGGGAPKKPNY